MNQQLTEYDVLSEQQSKLAEIDRLRDQVLGLQAENEIARKALQTIADGHRFNTTSLRPHEVHALAFNALTVLDTGRALIENTGQQTLDEEHLRKAFEEDAEPLGYSITRSPCDCGQCWYENEHTNNRWAGYVAASRLYSEAAQVRELMLLAHIVALRKTISTNHEWHENYDDTGSYAESELCAENLAASTAFVPSSLVVHDDAVVEAAMKELLQKSKELQSAGRPSGFVLEEQITELLTERRNRNER